MRMYRTRSLLPFLAIAALLLPLAAESPDEVVNPRRADNSFVSDGGGVLSPEYRALIDGVCRELQAKTTAELAVVTVGDLGGLVIEEFAEKVFRRFGIGVKGKDNGLLLLCSRDERLVRLEVGYGLEGDIPDALASRLLEREALAQLRDGRFGRGLFLAARNVAIQAAGDVPLTITEPTAWPAEAVPPKPKNLPQPKKKGKWDPLRSSLYFGGGILAFALLAIGLTMARFNKARGRAARARIAGGTPASVILAWIGGVISFFLVLGFGKDFLTPFVAMLAAPGLATFGRLFTGRVLKKRLDSYHLPCVKCGAAMDMAADSEDDVMLSTEEAAEEKAGGMDYEFWRCPKCGADEKLAVKLGKASKCPQCGRRTLKSSTTTLLAATREQGGRTRTTETCLNPKCNYAKTRESSTPRLSTPSSSSAGSSRPSGSFGGGRSGGGGASRKF
ncbi:MAG TPA: TPM domain-containing protein [Candidatus Aminicenantes bacterium]|nr:TPM domain-containing protein [Candidatus Aminicenantes bacterium]